MGVVEQVFESLKDIPESSVLALEANSDAYFDVIRAITEKIPNYKNLDVIYINSTLPASSIISVMDLLDIKRDHIYFVDCASSVLLTQQAQNDHVIFVESPTMLENIMLKVEYLMRKLDKKRGKLIHKELEPVNCQSLYKEVIVSGLYFDVETGEWARLYGYRNWYKENIMKIPHKNPALGIHFQEVSKSLETQLTGQIQVHTEHPLYYIVYGLYDELDDLIENL
jgi:hypothetical protein